MDTRRPNAEKEKEARAQEGQEDSKADLTKEPDKAKVHVGRVEDLMYSPSARKGRGKEKEKANGFLRLRKERSSGRCSKSRKDANMAKAIPESIEKVRARCVIMS